MYELEPLLMFCTGKVGEALGEALLKTSLRKKECHSQKIKDTHY